MHKAYSVPTDRPRLAVVAAALLTLSALPVHAATFTPPAPTAGARGGVLQQAAEAQLAEAADSAAIVAKVNSTLTKLKAAGLLA